VLILCTLLFCQTLKVLLLFCHFKLSFNLLKASTFKVLWLFIRVVKSFVVSLCLLRLLKASLKTFALEVFYLFVGVVKSFVGIFLFSCLFAKVVKSFIKSFYFQLFYVCMFYISNAYNHFCYVKNLVFPSSKLSRSLEFPRCFICQSYQKLS